MRCRGRGVGAALLVVAEGGRKLGCSQLELSSSLKREGPIASIWRRGYVERPKRFVKTV